MATTAETVTDGRLEIRPAEHTVLLDGVPLVLTVREIALLSELASHADRVLTREELYGPSGAGEIASPQRTRLGATFYRFELRSRGA